jgi:hypothetical protein
MGRKQRASREQQQRQDFDHFLCSSSCPNFGKPHAIPKLPVFQCLG